MKRSGHQPARSVGSGNEPCPVVYRDERYEGHFRDLYHFGAFRHVSNAFAPLTQVPAARQFAFSLRADASKTHAASRSWRHFHLRCRHRSAPVRRCQASPPSLVQVGGRVDLSLAVCTLSPAEHVCGLGGVLPLGAIPHHGQSSPFERECYSDGTARSSSSYAGPTPGPPRRTIGSQRPVNTQRNSSPSCSTPSSPRLRGWSRSTWA